MSLKRDVGVGLFWVALATLGNKGLALLRKLLLARLLIPQDFGLVAYATLIIGALEIFKEMGFGAALIYRKDKIEESADTIFIAVLASSAVLYGIAYLVSPLIGAFFHSTDLIPILRVLSLNIFLSAIIQVPATLMAKGMGFKRKAIPEMIADLIGSTVAVLLAFQGYRAWAIVYGQLTISTVQAILIWFYCPWRPKFCFSVPLAKELWGYGKHIIGSQAMVFAITNVDNALVGHYLGDASLGAYGLAYDLSNLPATHISRVVGQVMFPAFSRVQGDLNRLREAFFRSMKYVSLVAFPVAAVTALFAPDFVIFAYGAKWARMIVPLQLLTLYGLTRSVAVNMGNVFKAGGKPKWLFGIALWRLITMIGGLLWLLYIPTRGVPAMFQPRSSWSSIDGVAGFSAVVAVVDFVLSMVLTNRIIHASWKRYFRLLAPMLLIATAAAMLSHLFYGWIAATIHPFVSLPLAGLVAMILYGTAMYAYDAEIRATVVEGGRGLWHEFRRHQLRGHSHVAP
jgi:PST family polysaccharide transporter